MTSIIVIIMAALATGVAVWMWWSNRRLKKELAIDQSLLMKARQADADLTTTEARVEVSEKYDKAIARLNREVVHVGPDDDLSGAFDRASSRKNKK